ncbi:MAG: hypothetical protein ACI9SP_002806 [Arenicella sp.]|jgi:hypothetical protein
MVEKIVETIHQSNIADAANSESAAANSESAAANNESAAANNESD